MGTAPVSHGPSSGSTRCGCCRAADRAHRADPDELGKEPHPSWGDATDRLGLAQHDVRHDQQRTLHLLAVTKLLPRLKRGDILVMDNLTAHRDKRVAYLWAVRLSITRMS